jgi:hypothetical protein
MTRAGVTVLVALIACAVGACERPGPLSPTSTTPPSTQSGSGESGGSGGSGGSAGTVQASAMMGSWQATKVVAWRVALVGGGFAEVPGSRRDLVADGVSVTLLLEPTSETIGRATPTGAYTITVVAPGHNQGVDTGFWFFGPAWQARYQGEFQIDFYPDSLGPHPDYGDVPAFLVSLGDDQRTLKLWDSGLSFLPYDFGWDPWETGLELEFGRQ